MGLNAGGKLGERKGKKCPMRARSNFACRKFSRKKNLGKLQIGFGAPLLQECCFRELVVNGRKDFSFRMRTLMNRGRIRDSEIWHEATEKGFEHISKFVERRCGGFHFGQLYFLNSLSHKIARFIVLRESGWCMHKTREFENRRRNDWKVGARKKREAINCPFSPPPGFPVLLSESGKKYHILLT